MELEWLRYFRQYGERSNFEAGALDGAARATATSAYTVRTTLAGQRRAASWPSTRRLPEFGWTLTVMADHRPIVAARRTAWALTALALLALLLAGAVLAPARASLRRAARGPAPSWRHRVRERTRELQEAHAFRRRWRIRCWWACAHAISTAASSTSTRRCARCCGYTRRGAGRPHAALPLLAPRRHGASTGATTRPWSAASAALTGFESRVRHRDGHDVYTMVYTAPLIDGQRQAQRLDELGGGHQRAEAAEERQRPQQAQLQTGHAPGSAWARWPRRWRTS